MTHADRQRLHTIMETLMRHRSQLGYPFHDVRGVKDAETWKLTWAQAEHRLLTGGELMFDCSQSVTQIFRWAGCGDPNGLAYKHVGYTGTMLAHLRHYSDPKQARVGALVVFGPATGEHVACVLEPDSTHGDVTLFSHGARGVSGPIKLSVERRFHDPPVTFLDVSGL